MKDKWLIKVYSVGVCFPLLKIKKSVALSSWSDKKVKFSILRTLVEQEEMRMVGDSKSPQERLNHEAI